MNRTMSVDALRAGFRAHHLDSVLFPTDPIDNAPQIISDLSSFFPPADGRYVFGPMFALGWGTPTLITLSVGVILEIPDPVTIMILGEIKMALPTGRYGPDRNQYRRSRDHRLWREAVDDPGYDVRLARRGLLPFRRHGISACLG